MIQTLHVRDFLQLSWLDAVRSSFFRSVEQGQTGTTAAKTLRYIATDNGPVCLES